MKGWEEVQKTHVFVARKHKNGHITVAFFLVDLLCAGVKDAWYLFNIPHYEYRSILERFRTSESPELESCDYLLAHNLVYGGLDYAAEFGIEPPHGYRLASFILDEDSEDIPLIELPLGLDGKPCLMLYPDDLRQSHYLRQLQKNAGEGNFTVISADIFPDEDDNDMENEEYSDYENWSYEDWEDFLLNLEKGELMMFLRETKYIFEKCIHEPTLAGRQLSASGLTSISEIKITYDPINAAGLSKEELKVGERIYLTVTDPDTSKSRLKTIINEIEASIRRWPTNPTFHNYLYNAYIKIGRKKEADNFIRQTVEKFPDYYFAKVSYANVLLEMGKYDEMLEVFNGEFDLASVFPGRKEFHISEFVTFNTLMCKYFMGKRDIVSAVLYRNIIDEMVIPDGFPTNDELFFRLNVMVSARVQELIDDVQSDKNRKNEVLALLLNEAV